tara:strand:+ start:547 stop:831 length:285 start_codon:yes stop_codon:yes gene_type:complete
MHYQDDTNEELKEKWKKGADQGAKMALAFRLMRAEKEAWEDGELGGIYKVAEDIEKFVADIRAHPIAKYSEIDLEIIENLTKTVWSWLHIESWS